MGSPWYRYASIACPDLPLQWHDHAGRWVGGASIANPALLQNQDAEGLDHAAGEDAEGLDLAAGENAEGLDHATGPSIANPAPQNQEADGLDFTGDWTGAAGGDGNLTAMFMPKPN